MAAPYERAEHVNLNILSVFFFFLAAMNGKDKELSSTQDSRNLFS